MREILSDTIWGERGHIIRSMIVCVNGRVFDVRARVKSISPVHETVIVNVSSFDRDERRWRVAVPDCGFQTNGGGGEIPDDAWADVVEKYLLLAVRILDGD